jgi:N-acetylmuramate 1-kinase
VSGASGPQPSSPSRTPVLHQPVRDDVVSLWPETAGSEWSFLTPDGSDRTYYRLRSPERTVVLMVYRGQNATPVAGFCEVHRLLAAAGLPVPELLAAAPESGLFLIEDLGDQTLESAASALPAEDLARLYEQAVELLIEIQRLGPPASGPRSRCFELAFDPAKLGFEMDFFFRHLVGDFLGLDADGPVAVAARDEMDRLCRWLGERHPVLAHRDFHSRNLMVRRGRLRLIDYQDARLGRHAYDLASLLYDSYLDLGETLRNRLLRSYERLAGSQLPSDWPRELLPSAVQRNLKALGSFGFLMGKKQKTHFAGAVGLTLRHLERNLAALELPATAELALGPVTQRCVELGLAPRAQDADR